MNTITITSAIVLLILIILIGLRNRLVRKRNETENIFGTVDAILMKRSSLIPNLVATVQQYMVHEKDTLTQLTELRARAISPDISSDEKIQLHNKINQTLGGIMVAVEAYPDLKASRNFLDLQASLNEVEEQLSASRRAYNGAVTDYNNAVEVFPSNLVAGMMAYKRKAVLEATEAERKNVNVKELFKS